MTEWKGMGRTPVTRHRAGVILLVLTEADRPLTTQEVAKATGVYAAYVYSDLRRLAGTNTREARTLSYADPITAKDYPVLYKHWGATTGTYVTWELVPEYRRQRAQEIAALDGMWGQRFPL